MKTKTNRRGQFPAGKPVNQGLAPRAGSGCRMVFAHRPPGASTLTTAWSPSSPGAERPA